MKAKTKNVVTNTSSESHRDPFATFAKVLLGGGDTSGAIEAMERRGQEEFVASDVLPKAICDRPILEAWGFKFGKPIGGDSLFMQAKLPPGWSKKGSSHDMWSYIVDEQGRERCSVFYKAAFYDRDAFLNVSPRYRRDVEYEDEKLRMGGRSRGVVKEGGHVIFAGEWHSNPTDGSDYDRKYGAYDASQKDADVWFKANIPASLLDQWAQP